MQQSVYSQVGSLSKLFLCHEAKILVMRVVLLRVASSLHTINRLVGKMVLWFYSNDGYS